MQKILTALAFVSATAAFATEVALYDSSYDLTRQDGSTWSSTISLELGVFDSGFTPTGSNYSQWGVNFHAAGSAGYFDPSGPEWSTSFNIPENVAPFSEGARLYLWAYDSKVIDGVSQWLLLSDEGWNLGVMSATGTTQDIAFSSSTAPVFGTFDPETMTAATYSVTPIPEPATYAAVVGALALGVVGWRRYRRC